LAAIGYGAAAFMDNDVRSSDAAVETARTAGVVVVRWGHGLDLEGQICNDLDASTLTSLLLLGVELRNGEETALLDVNASHPAHLVSSLNVDEWIATGSLTLEQARQRVAHAARNRKWFKNVEAGRALGAWVINHSDEKQLASVMTRVDEVHHFVDPEPSVLFVGAGASSIGEESARGSGEDAASRDE
jgi:hypothetical protein